MFLADRGIWFEVREHRAGAVTPFGVLNDEERRGKVFVDRDFFEAPGLIGVC